MPRHYDVIATFEGEHAAEVVLEHLRRRGFVADEVAVLLGDHCWGWGRCRRFRVRARHRFAEGAALGGLIGGCLGAVIMLLTGVSAGFVGVGAGVGFGGVVGWMLGGMIGLGYDQHQAVLGEVAPVREVPDPQGRGPRKARREGSIAVGVRATSLAQAELAEQVFVLGGATTVAS